MNKEAGGVVLAFAGFVFLVGAFKGTWHDVIDALLGHSPTTAAGGVKSTANVPPGLPGTSVPAGTSASPLGRRTSG